MKFKIKSEVLKEWLSTVNHAVASVSTTPILETILLDLSDNKLVLTSNNLEMAIIYTISEWLEIISEGKFAIPSKLFSGFVSLVNDPEIEIELLSNNNLQITTSNWKTKIKWIEAEEFPVIPQFNEESNITIKWDILKTSIEKTIFSAAEWNIRPNLAWIYINISWDDIAFASTDSFRMSEYRTKLLWKSEKDFSQIIPSRTANEIKNIIKDDSEIRIISWENQIWFNFENVKVYSRLLNWNYPDYEKFFPTEHETRLEVNRVELMQALKKVNIISKENEYWIKISFENNTMTLDTWEAQIWEWIIKLNILLEWENNIIKLNSIYFLEALWVMETDYVEISFKNALSQILVKPIVKDPKKSNWTFRHIIMPQKI